MHTSVKKDLWYMARAMHGTSPACYKVTSTLKPVHKRAPTNGGFANVWGYTDEQNHDLVVAVTHIRASQEDAERIKEAWCCFTRN